MKKLLVLTMVLVSFASYGQKYVSRKSHINSINNQYIESVGNLYITIDGDRILFTNKKGDKIFEEHKLGETKKGDVVLKYSINEIAEGTTGKKELVRRSKDMFTDKSSKIIYELTDNVD